MNVVHAQQSHIPALPEVPPESHQSVIESLLAADSKAVAAAGKARNRAAAIAHKRVQGLRHLFGAKKYRQFRNYAAEQRKVEAEHFVARSGKKASLEDSERRRLEIRDASLKFVDELGVSGQDIAKLVRSTRREILSTLPHPPMREGKPVQILTAADVPSSIRAGKTNPWTRVTPPYPSWAWNYNGYVGGFSFAPTVYVDPAAGLAGNSNSLTDSDAGEFDVGEVEFNTSIGFWYRMPTTGLVETWIEAQSAASHHHVSLYDEFGWSNSFCFQRDYLTLITVAGVGAEQRESLMSWFDVDGYNSGSWDAHYLSDGRSYWAHLFSARPYTAGTWVYVMVGTRTYNKCFSNDVRVYSTVHFRWFIRSVWVDSTGS